MTLETWLYQDVKEDSEITYPKKKSFESLHKTEEQMARDKRKLMLNKAVEEMRAGLNEANEQM